MWTLFWDMHSGGRLKTKWHYIFIEAASEQEAMSIFSDRFWEDPYNITCPCCGSDFSVSSEQTLEEITAFHRGCRIINNIEEPLFQGSITTLSDFVAQPDVLVIPKTM